jgi:hypothetical protein
MTTGQVIEGIGRSGLGHRHVAGKATAQFQGQKLCHLPRSLRAPSLDPRRNPRWGGSPDRSRPASAKLSGGTQGRPPPRRGGRARVEEDSGAKNAGSNRPATPNPPFSRTVR